MDTAISEIRIEIKPYHQAVVEIVRFNPPRYRWDHRPYYPTTGSLVRLLRVLGSGSYNQLLRQPEKG